MLIEIGRRARAASKLLARASTQTKNEALLALADEIHSACAEILAANVCDVDAAFASGLNSALIDRLMLNDQRIDGLCADLRHLASLEDPVGQCFEERTLPIGIHLRKMRVPLGVLGVIYESRPNVTMDVAGLAIKTGNAAILRGGSETINSNRVLVNIVQKVLSENGLPADGIQFIDNPDREKLLELLKLNTYIDVIIPRGGAGLHAFCRENSQIPVITGGIGICHLFVDESAKLDASLPVIFNAKVQRPSTCNSLDTVLVHINIAAEFLPRIVAYLAPAGVSFRADPSAYGFLQEYGVDIVSRSGPDDFDTEWLSLILGLKVVSDLSAAIEHISLHSTAHSDGILTQNQENATRFVDEVDSAAVYVNASTRFTDGGQFGLGAEVAISTQRLHARGPMGLTELTTYKWVGVGDYTIRP